ncbi:TIGR02391 family protein [Streptomyces phaeochromogenes]
MITLADPHWAISKLSYFIHLTERKSPRSQTLFGFMAGSSPRLWAPEETIIEIAHVAEQIFDHVEPRWRDKLTKTTDPERRWEGHRESAIRIRSTIVHDEEIRKALGDNSPRLSASSLHSWVWGGARSLWQSGHFRDAVTAAAKKVNAETQNKISRRDLSETALFNNAFSIDPPKPGHPRLRLMIDDGSDTYKSLHRGARALAEGCYAGFRNPNSHQAGMPELPEHEALEQLAVFSVLARWVETSTVEV